MPTLADLFVRIRADDKQLVVSEAKHKAALSQLDKMKISPRIVIPDATPQIKAMQAKLAALSRTSINLGINSTLIKSEVATLQKQLIGLVAKSHKIPISLQTDQAKREIAEVRAALAAAEKKQTNIPVKLERVDAKIAALKGELAVLTKPVDVPVKIDQKHTLSAQLSAVRAALKSGLEGADVDSAGAGLGKKFGSSFSTGMKSILSVGLAAGVITTLTRAFTGAIGGAGDFERQMRLIGVVSGEAGANVKDLTRLAIDMGNKTAFSAKGASDAMLSLAKGGLTSAEIKAGALNSTLTLAAAGGLELGQSADFMVQGLRAFGLEAKDSAQVAAALAGAANASTASVESMGISLAQVGPGARSAGLSIQDTTAALAAFANAGIQGSDAGTSLKTFLTTIVPATKRAANAMQSLGLITEDGSNQFFDASGKVKGLAEVSGILAKALQNQSLEQRIATTKMIFGADAYRAATILSLEGAAGISKYTKATNDQAQAQTLAQTMMEGYSGALERVKGSAETASITFGTKLLPITEKFFGFLSGQAIPALSGFGNALAGILKVVGAVAGALGGTFLSSSKAVTVALTALLVIMTARKVEEFAGSLTTLGAKLQTVGGAASAAGTRMAGLGKGLGAVSGILGGPWGIAIGLGITALVSWATKSGEAAKKAKDFTDTLTFQNGVLDDNSRSNLANQLAKEGTLAAAIQAGVSEKDYTDALINGGAARQAMIDQLGGIQAKYTSTTAAGTGFVTATGSVGVAAGKAKDQLIAMGGGLDKSKVAADQAAAATGANATATDQAGEAAGRGAKLLDMLEKAQVRSTIATTRLKNETQALIDKFTILKDGFLDQESATNAWKAAIDSARSSLGKNGKTLSQNTKAGRENRGIVVDMARALNDKIVADFKATEKTKGLKAATDQASKSLATGTDRLREIAKKAGINRDQFDVMIKKMLKTPKEIKTETKTPGLKDAQKEVDRLKAKIDRLKAKKLSNSINFSTNAADVAKRWNLKQWYHGRADGGLIAPPKVARRAEGGVIQGTGGPRQDNIIGVDRKTRMQTAWVSAKEFVVNAAAYAKNRSLVHAINAGKKVEAVSLLANGGAPNSGPSNRNGSVVSRPIDAAFHAENAPNVDGFGNAFSRVTGTRLGKGIGVNIGRSLASKLQAAIRKAQAALTGGPGGGKMSGSIISIARRFHPSYIAGHRDPQGGPAYDIGSSGAKNRAIRGALAANHGRLGLRYVIGQMQIISGKNGWHWRRYSPITNQGDFRHVNHVHVSYANGGLVSGKPGRAMGGKIANVQRMAEPHVQLADGGVVRGGRGGVLARVGEGRNDELVQPLPRQWKQKSNEQSDKIDRLCALIEAKGLNAPTFTFGDVYNPREEALSQTINSGMQRVAALGLV